MEDMDRREPASGSQETKRFEQLFCLHCGGGNPPAALRCMWCGQPIDKARPQQPASQGQNLGYTQGTAHGQFSNPQAVQPYTAQPPTQVQPPQNPHAQQQYSQNPQYQQSYQGPYPQQPPPSVFVSQSQPVVVVGQQKSVAVALLLTFFFGPLGMFYSTVAGGLIMLVVSVVLGVLTGGLSFCVTWPVCMIWGAVAASSKPTVVTRY